MRIFEEGEEIYLLPKEDDFAKGHIKTLGNKWIIWYIMQYGFHANNCRRSMIIYPSTQKHIAENNRDLLTIKIDEPFQPKYTVIKKDENLEMVDQYNEKIDVDDSIFFYKQGKLQKGRVREISSKGTIAKVQVINTWGVIDIDVKKTQCIVFKKYIHAINSYNAWQ